MLNQNKIRSQYHPKNERMKYKYRQHLARIGQRDEKTIRASIKHIRDFEIYTKFEGFEKFNEHTADKYIKSILSKDFSLSHIDNNLRSLNDFFKWLERQKGYKNKISYNHIEYLSLSKNQRRTAKSSSYKQAYKFDQILAAIRQMPEKTNMEKRDKALISLQALCTLRISELRTIKISNIIQEDNVYFAYVTPKNMQVKFSKTRMVVFVPLGDDIQNNVIAWIDHLRSLGFGDSDPLFPRIDNRFGQGNFLEQSIAKAEIKSDSTIRNIFKKTFESAGQKYIRPHSFRTTLSRFAQNQTPAFLNAVRQNLGHSSIDTTLSSYGQLSEADQRDVISKTSISIPVAIEG